MSININYITISNMLLLHKFAVAILSDTGSHL